MAYSVRAGDGDNLGTRRVAFFTAPQATLPKPEMAILLAGDVLASLVEKVLVK